MSLSYIREYISLSIIHFLVLAFTEVKKSYLIRWYFKFCFGLSKYARSISEIFFLTFFVVMRHSYKIRPVVNTNLDFSMLTVPEKRVGSGCKCGWACSCTNLCQQSGRCAWSTQSVRTLVEALHSACTQFPPHPVNRPCSRFTAGGAPQKPSEVNTPDPLLWAYTPPLLWLLFSQAHTCKSQCVLGGSCLG